MCFHCNSSSASWKCKDCFASPLVCGPCLKDDHHLNPFHCVQYWAGDSFKDGWLRDVGLFITLGHGGKPCPHTQSSPSTSSTPNTGPGAHYKSQAALTTHLSPPPSKPSSLPTNVVDSVQPHPSRSDADSILHLSSPSSVLPNPNLPGTRSGMDGATNETPEEDYEPPDPEIESLPEPNPPGVQDMFGNRMMVLVHSTGIHRMGVHFCECPDARRPDLQLLEVGLYPASARAPRTAFTFTVLDEAVDDNVESDSAIQSFVHRLQVRTDPVIPDAVPALCLHLPRPSRC